MVTTTQAQPKSLLTISAYGDNFDIISLSKRIKVMVPGGKNLSDPEAQALAQVSLAMNCNPFIGEVWYIPGSGPMVGIKGTRRHGNEHMERIGGPEAYWQPDFQVCDGAEAGYKGDMKDLAAAYKCTITDSVSTAAYQKLFLETVNVLRAAGSKDPVGEAREICGKRPQWTDYGYSLVSEKSRMNKQALARKRAESHALQLKFSIPFGAKVAAGDDAVDAGDWIDAQAKDVNSPNWQEAPEEWDESQEVKQEAEPAGADALQMYRYNDAVIVAAVKKITSFSTEEAVATLHEAFKKNQIGKTLTIGEAEEFARNLISPK